MKRYNLDKCNSCNQNNFDTNIYYSFYRCTCNKCKTKYDFKKDSNLLYRVSSNGFTIDIYKNIIEVTLYNEFTYLKKIDTKITNEIILNEVQKVIENMMFQ